MKLRTTNDLLATDKGSLIIYCQDLHIEIERMRTDSTRYWRNRVEQAVAAEREACAAIAAKAGDDLDASGEGLLPCEAAYRVESAIRARGAKGGEKC